MLSRNNFVKVVKAEDIKSQALRSNMLANKLRQYEQQARPNCLACKRPIDLRQNTVGRVSQGRHPLPHGFFHGECETKASSTPDALASTLESYHNGITTAGLE